MNDGVYLVPTERFIELFPGSHVNITSVCSLCKELRKMKIADYVGLVHKDFCARCLRTKVLLGERSSAFGKSYCKGVPKSTAHKLKMSKAMSLRTGSKNPNWKSDTPEFKRFSNKVHRLTKETYEANIDTINPNRHVRTRCGVAGGYQLDHIVSIRIGFDSGMKAEELAVKENLQMIPWLDNLKKSCGRRKD